MGQLPASAFDEAYAVARVTPGTNLLAMYALLGERFAGWRGALTALAVGALVPALIAVALRCRLVGSRGASVRSRGDAGRTRWSACRICLGDRKTRPTAA